MVIRQLVLEGIRAGTVTLAFRRWRRPTVRTGGTLLTSAGQLSIEIVSLVERLDDITVDDARRAGYDSRDVLIAELEARPDGDVYRIAFGALGADPRVALRDELPDSTTIEEVVAKLATMDARSSGGPWTRRALDLIADQPGVLAAKLARQAGEDTARFKTNVRKLKALGLTESLEIGYRLSPRGTAVRRHR